MKNLIIICAICTVAILSSCSKNAIPTAGTENLEKNDKLTSSSATIAGAPSLTIGGYTNTPYISNGKWLGNACQGVGKYYNSYVINTNDNADGSNYWIITATNFAFGNSKGTVTSSVPDVTFEILSWTNTTIKVQPKALYTLQNKSNVVITVKNAANQPCSSKPINVIGMLGMGRGFGQCTWEAAYQRKLMGKNVSIPNPSAYSLKGYIDSKYIPQYGDVINWSGHTGFISSATKVVVSNQTVTINKVAYESLITYTFTLQERNYDCQETASSSTRTFTVRKSKTGAQIINSGISTLAGSKFGVAATYWR